MTRIERLAGATVLGRELADAKIALECRMRAYRRAQAGARFPSRFDRSLSSVRGDVRAEIAHIRDIARRVEARYGA